MANIKPLEDKIVVQASEAETTTASGIVIPDTAKEKPQEGKVLAVGPGRIDDKGNRVPLADRSAQATTRSAAATGLGWGGTDVAPVMTKPGRTGRPAREARARLAAFAPARTASRARSSSRL